jgi:hypothetical protein
MSENRVLRRIFGPKRKEVARGCRRLHNKELHYISASPNVIRVFKTRMKWMKHVAHTGDMRCI